MKEADIRKRELVDEMLRLAKDDVITFFSDKVTYHEVPCPACGKDTAELIAREEKCFSYRCQSCQHTYQKPPGWLERPPYFQEKLYSYQLNQKSIEERALEALQS